jgi:hypothetical protein
MNPLLIARGIGKHLNLGLVIQSLTATSCPIEASTSE